MLRGLGNESSFSDRNSIGWDTSRLGSWHCSHTGELRLLSFGRFALECFGPLNTVTAYYYISLLHIAPHHQIVPLVILQYVIFIYLSNIYIYKWNINGLILIDLKFRACGSCGSHKSGSVSVSSILCLSSTAALPSRKAQSHPRPAPWTAKRMS